MTSSRSKRVAQQRTSVITMHVLLTEQHFGDADGIEQAFRNAGCYVSRCHTQQGWCRALAPGTRCPFDEPGPPELVVDARGYGDSLTQREYGVVCALRAGCAVVVVPPEPGIPVELPAGMEPRMTSASVASVVDACRVALRQ